MLNNRCCNILLMLLKSENSIKLKNIAKEFDISERATRYDLDEIDNFLLKYDFEILNRKSNQGINYELELEKRYSLFKCIIDEREGTFYDTPAARLMDILINLMLSSECIFIDGESDRLQLSRSTVFKDFEKLRLLINKDVTYLSSSVAGFKLVGDECDMRLQVAKVVLSILESRDFIELIHYVMDGEAVLFSNKIYKLFEGIDMDVFQNTLLGILDYYNNDMSDSSFVFATIALLFGKKRFAFGYINENDDILDIPDKIREITDMFYEHESKKEYKYIMQIIKFIESSESVKEKDAYFPDLQLVSFNLVQKVSKIDFYVEVNKNIIKTLAEEYINLIFGDMRSKPSVISENEMDRESNIYFAIKEELSSLEKIVKREINDYDIGRFYRIFENERQKNKLKRIKKNVLIICPFDSTLTSMVKDKVKSMFEANVYECSGLKKVHESIKEYNIDLVISTIQLNLNNVSFVKISSFFGNDDFQELKNYLPNRIVDNKMLTNIYNILTKNLNDQQQIEGMIKDIGKELNVNSDYLLSRKNKANSPIDYCEFVEVENYDEAIAKAGELLKKLGKIEDGYISEMKREVEESKTHMVVNDGIVLIHSRSTEFVKDVGCVLLKLKNKVQFCRDKDSYCDLVFAISTTDSNSHLSLLGDISDVLTNKTKLEILKNSENNQEIMSLFQK